MTCFKIAIIGAGPAGCTLARLLVHAKTKVDITIFEGETSLDARTQGGTLDLHTESGLEAMKKMGLWDEFLNEARFDGEGNSIHTPLLLFIWFPIVTNKQFSHAGL